MNAPETSQGQLEKTATIFSVYSLIFYLTLALVGGCFGFLMGGVQAFMFIDPDLADDLLRRSEYFSHPDVLFFCRIHAVAWTFAMPGVLIFCLWRNKHKEAAQTTAN